ncbi:hypothetical protein KIN20_017897 [Parelaphostrongylus tenuis]|uniref:Uncharacterized protein n=1 Tax=Parelaphostrongylus tenuis TaxID=148309 RepID=A0AAD5N0G1_PARTN|nr:hypothetical protein KIN20_017897 [Parelaphostrongylus tenuis]
MGIETDGIMKVMTIAHTCIMAPRELQPSHYRCETHFRWVQFEFRLFQLQPAWCIIGKIESCDKWPIEEVVPEGCTRRVDPQYMRYFDDYKIDTD